MLTLIFVFLLTSSQINAYKVLIYSPKFVNSHVTFMGKVADILAKAGHDVVVYQPTYDPNITTTGAKLARVIERPLDFDPPASLDDIQGDIWSTKEQDMASIQKTIQIVQTAVKTLCKHQLSDTPLMEKLRQEKFDLALGETFDTCYYGVLEHIGVEKYITVFPAAFFNGIGTALGIPSTPSQLPGMIGDIPPLGYLARAKNLFFTIIMDWANENSFLRPNEEIIRPIVRKNFDVLEKISKSALIFSHVDEHVDFNRLISHKIIYIGGLDQASPKKLDRKYEKIMNDSKDGVILVSFGSVAHSYKMSKTMKKKFLEMFSEFANITFIWKYEKEEDRIAEGYENVITDKWLPQPDLLAHPKMLAFITHGGGNSLGEATHFGIPLICIPLFADQPRNALVVKYRKIGLPIEKQQILDGKLPEVVREVVTNPIYRKHAKRLSDMIQAKPMSPDEKLIKYTEFAARFGNDLNLDLPGKDQNFVQFYCLDIILPFLIVVFLFLYGVLQFCVFLLRFFVVSKKEKRE